MKIGLLDIDSHNFPNLALMKISAHHKSIGDQVEWVNHFNNYDIVYQSKVFTFTPDNGFQVNSDQIIKGGTGYNIKVNLPDNIDSLCPDYSIYPKYKSAYGFLTRGCPNKCWWCIVPEKEGGIYGYSDIENFLDGRISAILMDNNILYSAYGIKQIEKIIKLNIKVDFNQGLDCRAIDRSTANLLSKVKWIRHIRTSCDTIINIKHIEKALENLNYAGIKNYKVFVYVMLLDLRDSYFILNWLKENGCDPFAQPYRSFDNKPIPQWQLDMAQWVNKKSNFMSCDFKKYKPRKGFICNQYFKA